MSAAANGRAESVRLLLDAGADKNGGAGENVRRWVTASVVVWQSCGEINICSKYLLTSWKIPLSIILFFGHFEKKGRTRVCD